MKNEKQLNAAVSPGEILNEEFLKPLALTANALAKAIGVPPNRITAILKNQIRITGDRAIRLGTFFETMAEEIGVWCQTFIYLIHCFS